MDTDTVVTETLSQAVARQAAEIERLRKLMDDAEDVMKRQRAERLEQKAEIERLREELVVAEQVGGKLMEEREQLGHEIERLRGLLRETHLALSFMPDPTRKLLDLRYRLREALGE